MRWATGTPEHFLIHVRGVFHAIKEMELDAKFQKVLKAVESATLGVNFAKMTYKDETKKREKDDTSQQAVGASKAAPDMAKNLKKEEGDESLHAMVIAAKAAFNKA